MGRFAILVTLMLAACYQPIIEIGVESSVIAPTQIGNIVTFTPEASLETPMVCPSNSVSISELLNSLDSTGTQLDASILVDITQIEADCWVQANFAAVGVVPAMALTLPQVWYIRDETWPLVLHTERGAEVTIEYEEVSITTDESWIPLSTTATQTRKYLLAPRQTPETVTNNVVSYQLLLDNNAYQHSLSISSSETRTQEQMIELSNTALLVLLTSQVEP